LPTTINLDSLSAISFLHIDLNAAEPEVASLKLLWDLITPGGIVVLDDYCHHGRRAQFIAMNELAIELQFSILSLPTGQGLIIKP
jgi:predicted O-methyltransferase YrrM